jgi:hypothetical protein
MPFPGPRFESEISNNNLIVLGIYPNPVVDGADVQFYLSEKSDINISVIDISGKAVLSKDETGVNEGLHVEKIDMTSLSKGIYVLNIRTAAAEYSRKIIKD